MNKKFEKMCSYLAAYNCYRAGQNIAEIAASAQVSESTVRRWLNKHIPAELLIQAKCERNAKRTPAS